MTIPIDCPSFSAIVTDIALLFHFYFVTVLLAAFLYMNKKLCRQQLEFILDCKTG